MSHRTKGDENTDGDRQRTGSDSRGRKGKKDEKLKMLKEGSSKGEGRGGENIGGRRKKIAKKRG